MITRGVGDCSITKGQRRKAVVPLGRFRIAANDERMSLAKNSNAFTSAFKELDPVPQFKATAKLGEFLERPGSRKRSSRRGGGRTAPRTSGRLPEWLAAVKFARDVPKGRSVRPSSRENYDFLIRTLWILARNDLGCVIRATLQALESEFCHVRKNSNDDSVHGRYCILRALPGGAIEGTRASFEWLLGEVAPQLWRRLDRCTTRAQKTSDSRDVRTHGRAIILTRRNILRIIVTIALLVASWAMLGTAVAQRQAVPKPQGKLALGENEVKRKGLGKNQLVVVVVSLDGGHYRGSASFKQSNFGISPIRIAGGNR
jgi:hypothetical protein